MFGNSACQSSSVEDRCVVIDVSQHDPHLGVASQRRLSHRRASHAAAVRRLVVCEHVEVPDGSTSGQVAVERPRDVHLTGVRVDDERTVVGELTRHGVADT